MKETLNDLILDERLLAGLYGKVLVESTEGSVPVLKSTALPPLHVLGNNTRLVTVLVNDPEYQFLSEEALAFLTKILSACGLNLADTAIVNTAGEKDWERITSQTTPEKVLSFGVPVPGSQAEIFSNTSYRGILCVYAPPLMDFIHASDQAKQLKTRLWSCLKDLFQIP